MPCSGLWHVDWSFLNEGFWQKGFTKLLAAALNTLYADGGAEHEDHGRGGDSDANAGHVVQDRHRRLAQRASLLNSIRFPTVILLLTVPAIIVF